MFTGIITDIGWVALIVTAAGVVAPLVFHLIVMKTGWGTFLFVRPKAFHIDRPQERRDRRLQPAE